MARNIQRQTKLALRDLHARESMRLGWYRQTSGGAFIQHLRERKAQHQAFLGDLLRRRDATPGWYSRAFYYMGHLFGWFTALMPDKWARWMEHTLEFWILFRYEKYLRSLKLDANLRSMIEAMQMHKLHHDEPAQDVLQVLASFAEEQQQLIKLGGLPA